MSAYNTRAYQTRRRIAAIFINFHSGFYFVHNNGSTGIKRKYSRLKYSILLNYECLMFIHFAFSLISVDS